MAQALVAARRVLRPPALLAALTFGLAAAVVEQSAAQAKPAAKAKTTLNGVYTSGQAVKGEEMYYNLCINCHPKGTYAGPSFKTNWNNRPLSDLWDWISNKMPKNDPGTLAPQEVVQVMAYILQQNKMPAGTVALPPNEKTLGTITILLK